MVVVTVKLLCFLKQNETSVLFLREECLDVSNMALTAPTRTAKLLYFWVSVFEYYSTTNA